MFDLLKKKFSSFVDRLKGKEESAEEKPPEKIGEPPPPPSEKPIIKEKEPAPDKAPPAEEKREEKPPEEKKPREKPIPKTPPEKPAAKPTAEEIPKPPEKAPEKPAPALPPKLLPTPKPEEKPPEKIEEKKGGKPPEKKEEKPVEKKEIPKPEAPPKLPAPPTERPKEELEKKVKRGFLSAVKETITGVSEVREEEISGLLEELELGLLESDVALEVADEIKSELGKRVVGAKVKKGKTAEFIRDQLYEILVSLVSKEGFSLPERVRELEKPVKIMVLGPNGSGKTTTIAKLAKMLKDSGLSAVVAASDTFRAAAVEQLQHHGEKVGFKVLSASYGSDPTALAYDAVNYAKANKVDVVLIDTAGRQETNVNLLNQLKKMNRVIQPDIKIYVGESIAGNAITEQISTFEGEIGLDGVILTKLDCDAKGGTVISVTKVTGLPIIYVGVGQGYDDIERFEPKKIIGEILS